MDSFMVGFATVALGSTFAFAGVFGAAVLVCALRSRLEANAKVACSLAAVGVFVIGALSFTLLRNALALL